MLEGYIVGIDFGRDVCEGGYAQEDHPICPFDIGDENGLCIKASFGCHIVGCEFADE
jgi:hypothetical protein